MRKKTKYFTLLYKTKTEKLVQTSLKKNRFIFEPPNNEMIFKMIKGVNKIYFLVANSEKQIINGIIKQTEFKHNTLKFEIKTKNEVTFTELENSNDFNEKGMELFEDKADSFFISDYEAILYELTEKEEEIFEEIRDAMKSIYKNKKKNNPEYTNPQQNLNEGLKNIINNPFLYHMLNYQQMCIAMQKQLGNPSQIPPMFSLPVLNNYYKNEQNNYSNTSQNKVNTTDSQSEDNNKQGQFQEINNININTTGNNISLVLFDENLMDPNEKREKYFDLKDVQKYNELDKELHKKYDDMPNRNNNLILPSSNDTTNNEDTEDQNINFSNSFSNSYQKKKSDDSFSKRKNSSHYQRISSSNSRNTNTKRKRSFTKKKHSRSREKSFSSRNEYNPSNKSSSGSEEEGIYAKKILYEKKNKIKNLSYTPHMNFRANKEYRPYPKQNTSLYSSQMNNKYYNPHNNYQYYNNSINISSNNIKNKNANSSVKIVDISGRKKIYLQRDRKQNETIKLNPNI